MSKKKETKKIFENLEPESTEAHTESTESGRVEPDAPAAAPEPVQGEETPASAETSPQEPPEPVELPQQEEEESPDDILDDVRRSLIEEDSQEQQEEQSKWWKRFGRSRKKAAEPEAPQPVEINLPSLSAMQMEEAEADVREDPPDPIDELIDLLDAEEEEPVEYQPSQQEVDLPVEPEKPVDIEELKRQAFQPRPSEEEESQPDVRAIALEDGEEVFVEVETKAQDPLEERISAVENALTPYRRTISFVFAFLGLVMAVTAAFLIYNAYQRTQAQEVAAVEEVSNLPFPTSVSLPGGWSFNLGKGSLVDGQWNPAGAEWLQGTEVCRWVALPWSRQLEAVIRTLNPDDPIKLGMSNNDVLTYNVYSIEQMSPAQMQRLDTNTPCLLIVLAEPETEDRWVLTALP